MKHPVRILNQASYLYFHAKGTSLLLRLENKISIVAAGLSSLFLLQ